MKPGLELNKWIAEHVMGWMKVKVPEGHHLRQFGYEWAWKEREGDLIINCQKVMCYSTDIKAAWEVVEKISAKGYDVLVHRGASGHGNVCIISKRISGPFPLVDLVLHPSYLADSIREAADTAPHAICLAARKLMEE